MIAIIPARGGSKGLPGKNIKKLNGKPLISHTIEAALSSKKISRVIISTDDEEIVNVCKDYDVEIPFLRPKELAKDDSLIVDTYLYTIEKINHDEKTNYNSLVALLPTCPFRTGKDIDSAIEIFEKKDADSVISFYEAPHPVQWYRTIDEKGILRALLAEGDRLANRQEEKKSYLPNGAIYVFKTSLLKQNLYYSDKTYPYIMPASRSIDIDSQFDFDIAECLAKNIKKDHE